MSQSAHNPALTAALQALLRSPVAGQAVADKLLDSTDTWQRQSLIADLRARRAWEACDAAAARDDARRQAGNGAGKSGASPWHREAAAVDALAEPNAHARLPDSSEAASSGSNR